MDWNSISPWATISSSSPQGQAEDVTTGGLGQIGIARTVSALSPSSPLFWFGVLGAATFGLIGVSTHLRVGPFKASASV